MDPSLLHISQFPPNLFSIVCILWWEMEGSKAQTLLAAASLNRERRASVALELE